MLKNLKIYLKIINWFRLKIVYYAQIIKVLQNFKINLLKKFSIKSKKIHAQYCKNTSITSSNVKLQSFKIL